MLALKNSISVVMIKNTDLAFFITINDGYIFIISDPYEKFFKMIERIHCVTWL